MNGTVSELTLLVLRIGFLLLLWLFVFAVVYALRSDLFGSRVRKLPEPVSAQPASAPTTNAAAPRAADATPTTPSTIPAPSGPAPHATAANTHHLIITSGTKRGTEIPLGPEPLTIGRSAESGLVIRDDYTSTHHARLMLWSDEWMLQDLDSTNGTFLDGVRVTVPQAVPLGTPIKVGMTTFELRR